MKFLLDVHISTSLARVLVDEGHDVVRAGLGYADWPDDKLLALAVDEGRIIITQDSDFSDLVYAFGAPPPPAILYLRVEPEDQLQIVARVMATLETGRLDNHLVVIRPSSTRYRPLPQKSNDNG